MRLIGIISFSLYLWHWFIVHWAAALPAPRPARMAAYYGATLLVGLVSYLAFERPLSRVRLRGGEARPGHPSR